jgi:hypothetical protein
MRLRLAILGMLLAAGPAGAQQSVTIPASTASTPIAGTIATATALVNGIAGQRIYVTSVDLVPVATSVVTFTSGTGATCTTPSNVTGALTFSAGQTYSKGVGAGAVWVLPPGASLCITVAVAAAPGSLAYSQF